MTYVEKIFARAAGYASVRAGQAVELPPDLITMYDWPGISDYCLDIADKYGKLDVSKLRMYVDHKMPPVTIADNAFHNKTIKWCAEHGVPLTYAQGIGHQITAERGLVKPGDVVVHFDRHVNILGALGVFSVGTRLELIQALGKGKFSILAPQSIRVNFTGKPQKGVLGRDIFNKILQDLGPDAAPDQVIEFGGEGALHVSMDSRLTICCLAMFLGCMTAMFVPDEVTRSYYKERFGDDVKTAGSDQGCSYLKTLEYDLGKIEPMIVVPPRPQDAVLLRQVAGTPIHQGNIASCAAGRLEDIETAARILSGRKVKDGFRLYVTPSSTQILQESVRRGYVETLTAAGAIITSSTCDFCYGRQGVPADGENVMATGTLNIPARMGNINAEIYIGSAASVAAAAVTGTICDPRDYL